MHTASDAGSAELYDAMFARYGFIVSNDLDEAVTIAAVLASSPPPKGNRVAIVTTSGGGGIWATDVVCAQGLQVPTLSAATQARIRPLMPSYGAAANPVDVTAQAVHSGGLQKAIALLNESDEIDSILIVLSLSNETRVPLKPDELQPVVAAQRKPILLWSYTLPSQFARVEFAKSGVVVLSNLTQLATALRHGTSRSLSAGGI